MTTYVRIDVSKLSLDVAVVLNTGESKHYKVTNDDLGHETLIKWLTMLGSYQVILEATGSYHQKLLAYLHKQKQSVTLLNPRQSNAYAKSVNRRNKTDRVDALLLAMYGRERQPQISLETSSEQQSLAREIEALSEDIRRLKNRLEAIDHGKSHPEVSASLKRRIRDLQEEKKQLEKQLEHDLKDQKAQQLALLESIPGIGRLSACLLLAELGDIKRFESSRSLVAFAGLNPGRFESGTSVYKQAVISRQGSARLRHLLYMPAVTGLRFNARLKDFFHRLTAKGKPKMVALTACMAKLLRIIFGVLSSGKPFNPVLSLDNQHGIRRLLCDEVWSFVQAAMDLVSLRSRHKRNRGLFHWFTR
jgi:transposase